MAKAQFKDGRKDGNAHLHNISKPSHKARAVASPSMLEVYCNVMELMRLRNEIIMVASECAVLQKLYTQQAADCNRTHYKCRLPDSVSFPPLEEDGEEPPSVNYVDQGPANGITIDLAASEFDPTLLSNMNYKHPDSFQLSILTSGLEEVRAVLAYQVMQKHLLIVACHTT
jgi:hypothetical protein